jgi:hypothetical protein
VTIRPDGTLRQVAFEVCTALDRAGAEAVLTGGGAASVYAPDTVRSDDLDFVLTWSSNPADTVEVLAELGFVRKRGTAEYKHPSTHYFIEFLPGPLAVGEEIIKRWETLREGLRILHLLSATDSCRDRLAAFYHWSDRNALRQALAVAQANQGRLDLNRIRRWSLAEGHGDRCSEFLSALARIDGGAP